MVKYVGTSERWYNKSEKKINKPEVIRKIRTSQFPTFSRRKKVIDREVEIAARRCNRYDKAEGEGNENLSLSRAVCQTHWTYILIDKREMCYFSFIMGIR